MTDGRIFCENALDNNNVEQSSAVTEFAVLEEERPSSALRKSISSTNSIRIEDPSNDNQNNFVNLSFRDLVFDHFLIISAIFYLSFGIVAATIFCYYKLKSSQDKNEDIWKWIGLMRCFFSFLVILLGLWYKIIIYGKKDYLENIRSKGSLFYYTIVIIPVGFSWFYFALKEIRSLRYLYQNRGCTVLPNVLLPIMQMILSMIGIMITFDLNFFKLKVGVPKYFYFVYKSATLLYFVECINYLIFNIIDIEIGNIKNNEKWDNISTNSTCMQYSLLEEGSTITYKIEKFSQVFVAIFFIQSIDNIRRSFHQFFEAFIDEANNPVTEISIHTRDKLTPVKYSKFNIEKNLFTIFWLFFISAIIPLQSIRVYYISDVSYTINITIYLISGILSIYLLKVVNQNIFICYNDDAYTMNSSIIWISLCGIFIFSITSILNSLQKKSIIFIGIYSTEIFQVWLQTIFLYFINKRNKKWVITNTSFPKVSYLTLFLISLNFGFFFAKLYVLNTDSDNQNYMTLIPFNILKVTIDSLILLYRAYAGLSFSNFYINCAIRH